MSLSLVRVWSGSVLALSLALAVSACGELDEGGHEEGGDATNLESPPADVPSDEASPGTERRTARFIPRCPEGTQPEVAVEGRGLVLVCRPLDDQQRPSLCRRGLGKSNLVERVDCLP